MVTVVIRYSMMYRSVIVCVSSGRTVAVNTKYKEEFPEKWKESFIVHVNLSGYKGLCND